jgi:3-methyladenine DNA glycosylase AlkD
MPAIVGPAAIGGDRMGVTTMSAGQIMKELAKLGNEGYKKTMLKHGSKEPFFGVKIEELKKYQKKIKKDYALALALYETGNGDAMYLAGLIADETKMTKKDLDRWLKRATSTIIVEYTVPWVAAESESGYELAKEWIESDDENIASAGWSTLGSLVAVRSDEELDLKGLEKLMARVAKSIHKAPERVKYTMNGFIIAVGAYVAALSEKAVAVAKQIGKVTVDMGDTDCKVPSAVEYIAKAIKRNGVGKKRMTARC